MAAPVLLTLAGRRTVNLLQKLTRIRMFLNTLWWCIPGIIENHEPLREALKARGYTFVSKPTPK